MTRKKASESHRFQTDVTKRKDLLERIIETAPSIIIGVNLAGKITIFNRTAEAITEYSKKEAIGQRFILLLVPERQWEDINGILNQLKEGNPTYDSERYIISKNGEERCISWNCTAINDDKNKVIGGIFIGNDITEKESMLKEIIRRNTELTAINSVGLSLSQMFDLDAILKRALDSAIELIWSGCGAIFLLDENEDNLTLRINKGISPETELAFKSSAITQGILGKVVQYNNPLLIGNFSLLPEKTRIILENEGFSSIAIIPLRVKGGVVGVLLIGPKDSMKLGAENIKVFSNICNQIGIAVDNARLFEKLSTTEMEWENTFNSIVDPIAIFSREKKILRCNNAYATKMDTGKEILLGKSCCEVFHGTDQHPHDCPYQKMLDRREASEEEIYDPDTGMTASVSCFPYFNANDERIGSIYLEKDITEKKETENEIQYLKEFNEGILENLGDGLEIIGEDHKIQFMNRAFYNSVGKDVIGKTCYRVHFERDEPCHGCPIMNGIENLGINTLELVTPDEKTLLITHSRLKNSDGSYSAILLFKEITEKKRMVSELMRAEEMASIAPLISGIADEMNNPLEGVLEFAEAILNEQDPEKLSTYSREIIDATTKVSNTINWLSQYSQGSLDHRTEPIDLNEIIELSLEMMRIGKDFENVEVMTELAKIPKIEGNLNEIKQVFITIISNAIQAMNGNGKIYISTEVSNGTIQAIVRDNSAGISKEDLEKIFDPFISIDGKDIDLESEKWKNTLGMYAASTILKNHNGELNVGSEVGKGTTFTITFPHMETEGQNS